MSIFEPDDLRSAGPARPPAGEQALVILFGAMASALVVLGVILPLIGHELVVPDPIWTLVVVLAATAAAWGAVLILGVPRATTPASPAQRVQALMILRLAILEAPAIVGLAFSFVTGPPSLLVYVIPAMFALAGMWLLGRPSVVREAVSRAA